jgi:type IV pilus assembly protein PilW
MIHNPLKSSRSGFSLVELMIAMVIAIVSLGAIYGVFASVQKTSTSNEVTAGVMQSLRTSVDFMESDIRMAGLDRFGSAAAGIEVATATNLRFTADRNMNGTIDTTDLSDGL